MASDADLIVLAEKFNLTLDSKDLADIAKKFMVVDGEILKVETDIEKRKKRLEENSKFIEEKIKLMNEVGDPSGLSIDQMRKKAAFMKEMEENGGVRR